MAFNFIGQWDAKNNVPNLSNGTGTPGDAYSIYVAGTQNLGNGNIAYLQAYSVVYINGQWIQLPLVYNTDFLTGGSGLFSGMIENISFEDSNSSIAAQTYTIELYAAYDYTIDTLNIISGAGTCTVAIQINGNPITGINGISVSSVLSSSNSTGANTVLAGNTVTLVISSTSGLNNLQASIQTTRL